MNCLYAIALLLMNDLPFGILLTIALFLGNLPFAIIQRYNRFRLQKLRKTIIRKQETIVKKGTLIQKATTGADGTAKFTADLPLGFSYDVKEVQAPEGYVRNTDDVYTFAFSYTNDKEAKQTFKHTFKKDRKSVV